MDRKALTTTVIALTFAAAPAAAQELEPATDTARYVLDTAFFLFAGFGAIAFVVAFGLRDVGLARTQHAPAVCLRTIGLLAVTALAFWLAGYSLIYNIEPGGFLGVVAPWRPADQDPLAAGRASGAFWFFQMGLAAVPSALVASALSERVKLWPFLLFVAAMGGLIYPVVASWVWSDGYFHYAWRFFDLGGAAAIHVAGGAAALAAAFTVGPRVGRYLDPHAPRPTPTTALPLSAFAAGIAFLSWIAAIAGMSGSLSTIEAAVSVATIVANLALAAAGAILTALFLTQIVYKRAGLVTSINAALAGLVALSGDPLHPLLWQATMIGAVGGVIVTVAPPFLDRFRIDDAGFVVPAHFLCGAWGLIIVPWSNPDAWFPGQLLGLAAVALFSFTMSLLIWTALKYSIGVRPRPVQENQSELLRGEAPPQKG